MIVAPAVLPLRSVSDLIESSFARVMMTPFADRVRLGQVVFALAFGGDGDLVGHHVEPVGLQRGEDRIPGRLDEFDLLTELLADRVGDVDVVAGELPVAGSWKLNGA